MRLCFLLVLYNIIVISNQAQVTIGSSITPPKGSLLNLQQYKGCSNNTTSTKGLLLPRVGLTSINSIEDIKGADSRNSEDHTGLMVYNINNFNEPCLILPSGLYVWDGNRWQNLEGKETHQPSGSYSEDVLVLKRIKDENKQASLDWRFDEKDTENIKFIEGTGVFFKKDACGNLRLSKLEIKNQTALSTLNISGATSLKELICVNNSSLKQLYISDNPNLKVLRFIRNSALDRLDLTEASGLTYIYCYGNSALTSLNVSSLLSLVDLRCHTNPSLAHLDISGTYSLTHLDCFATSLLSLDVSHASLLKYLRCDTNTQDRIKVILDEEHKHIELVPNSNSGIYDWR